MLPGDVIQSPEQLPEDDSLPARYHLLPGIEEPEFEEVMVEEGGPVGEANQTLELDNAGDVKSTALQQRPDARDRGAMLDMGMESLQFLALTRQNLLEDRVELAHVTLKIRRQCQDSAGACHPPAFPDRRRAILKVVHSQIRDDQVEGGVGERHRGRTALVQSDVPRFATGDLDACSVQGSGPGVESRSPVAKRGTSLDRKSTRLNSSHQIISYA